MNICANEGCEENFTDSGIAGIQKKYCSGECRAEAGARAKREKRSAVKAEKPKASIARRPEASPETLANQTLLNWPRNNLAFQYHENIKTWKRRLEMLQA